MNPQNAFVMDWPNLIANGLVLIPVMIWLCYMLSKPPKQRIVILLRGLAIIAFVVGYMITIGPNPQRYYGGVKNSGLRPSGPLWGIGIGAPLALVLMIAASRYQKKG